MKEKRTIQVTSGTAAGPTHLAAFDAALLEAGIANTNLIKLSSVIPTKSRVVIGKPTINFEKDFGSKLYVVLADKRESERGREAWAGLGWVQAKDGKGLFVEQHGSQQAEVMRLIKDTLEEMIKNRHESFGPIQYQVVGAYCERQPVCALVAAVYAVEGWGLL